MKASWPPIGTSAGRAISDWGGTPGIWTSIVFWVPSTRGAALAKLCTPYRRTRPATDRGFAGSSRTADT